MNVFRLLAHELRLAFRWRHDSQRWGRFAILAIFAALLLGLGWAGANVLAAIPPDRTTPTLAGVSIVIAFVATLMFGHALIATTEAVYTRGDLDFLLSSPVSPLAVLTVRALGVAVSVATVYAALGSGVLVSLALLQAWQWLAIGPALIGLTLAATAFGLVATMAMFATIGPRATRVTAQVLGALIGASLVLAFQIPNIQRGPDGRNVAAEALLARLTTLDWPPDHPLLFPARAFLGDGMALLWWTLGCAALFAFAALWFSGRFSGDAAAALAAAPRRRAPPARPRPFRGGVTLSLLLKEWRLLRRDPVLLSQILLQLVYLLPLAFMWSRQTADGEAHPAFLGLMGGAMAAIAASLAGALSWITVSAEDAPDLVAAAPVDRTKIDRAKMIAAAMPVIFLVAAGAAFIAQSSLSAGLWTFAGGAVAAISAGLVGVWHQEAGSRKDFRRRPRASWTAQLGQSFVTIGWAAATGFAASGAALVAILPAVIALGLLLALGESRRRPA